MKAALLLKTGKTEELKNNLLLRDRQEPEINKNEVLIRLKYAGLNHRDLWITKGLYSGISLPVVLGSDGAGVVLKAGEEVTKLKEGDDVFINPTFNWGETDDFQDRDFSILGLPEDGTFQEIISVHKDNVHKIPSSLNLKTASAFPLAGVTAFRACFTKSDVSKGKKVLITGAGGGVATMAVKFCLAKQADVYVTSGNDDKIEKLVTLGIKCGFNYRNESWEKRLIDTSGNMDIIIDGSGGNDINKYLNILNPGGKLIIYGATSGLPKDLDLRKIFWKQLKISGTTMGSPNDFSDMIKFIEKNKIEPVIDKVYSLEEIADAFLRMDSGEQMGKILVKL
ncbi:zinc-binding dehydrogenase [soil metagenome]